MDEHMIRTYVRKPEVFESGEGAVLRTADGREFLDCLAGIAVSGLGHGHPELVEALRDQVGKVLHVSNLFRHPYTEQVAQALHDLSGLSAAFFTNSGAEANEAALKLARKAQKVRGQPHRTGFVAFEHGFHGRTFGALSVTANPAYRTPFEPVVPGAEFLPVGDEDALEHALARQPAAVIIEPIQGEGGIRDVPLEFLQHLRTRTEATGTLLIHDEVQSGCGRTGKFLAGEWAEVQPDIATLAKPLAAGLPMGACLVREELREVLVPGDHGTTFGGGPLVCRAALVFLSALQSGLMDQVTARGEQLRAGLAALQAKHPLVASLRGRGLIQAIVLDSDALPDAGSKLQQALYDHGVITNNTSGTVVRFLPPYVITDTQIQTLLATLDACLHELSVSAP